MGLGQESRAHSSWSDLFGACRRELRRQGRGVEDNADPRQSELRSWIVRVCPQRGLTVAVRVKARSWGTASWPVVAVRQANLGARSRAGSTVAACPLRLVRPAGESPTPCGRLVACIGGLESVRPREIRCGQRRGGVGLAERLVAGSPVVTKGLQ